MMLPTYRRKIQLSALLFALAAITVLSSAGISAQDATPSSNQIDLSGATVISLSDATTIQGDGASLDGSDVVISASGAYVLSGNLPDGMVRVIAPDASVDLVLDGATISNSDGPAIHLQDAAAVTIWLAGGSTNVITDGGVAEQDAALYGDVSFTIRGDGDLNVNATYEGISSTEHIVIESGTIRVHAVEDGLNANQDGVSEINISGGLLFVETETGDGIDSNGSITITGGTVITQGAMVDANSGLDADGPVLIDGGTVIATGAMMSPPDANSAQGIIFANFGETQMAGTVVVVRNGDTNLLTFAPSIGFNALYYSAPEIVAGVTYDIYLGGTGQGEAVDGIFADGNSDSGTLATSVDTSSSQQGGRRGGR